MRVFFLMILSLVLVSTMIAVEIDLGMSVDVTQSDQNSLSCARLSLLGSIGPISLDIPVAQVWPSERRIEFSDPFLSYVGLNLKLPITVLYIKAGLGVQVRGVIDVLGAKIEGWDLPAGVTVGLGVSDSGLFLEGGLNLDFTPSLENIEFCPYIAAGLVF
ncbi:hypothetical protein [Mesotoga sp.]|uniref:hypothetical protein n=1 Tax=Mesotoga sp. TaxID=2053577 RepID=UPI001BD2C487